MTAFSLDVIAGPQDQLLVRFKIASLPRCRTTLSPNLPHPARQSGRGCDALRAINVIMFLAVMHRA